MAESNGGPDITPELYFLIAKFLSGGPLKETAKVLLKELQSVEVLPRRVDWEGGEWPLSFDELSAQYKNISWSRLAEVCSQLTAPGRPLAALAAGAAAGAAGAAAGAAGAPGDVRVHLSLLSDSLLRPPPKYSPFKPDHSLLRGLTARELGAGRACAAGGAGGAALLGARLLSGVGLQRRTLGHLSAVYCLVFDCTGRYVVTGADDQLVKVWSARDGRLVSTLRGAGAEISDVCVSRDGRALACGSTGRAVRVWELSAAAPRALLQAHAGAVTAVHWSPMIHDEVRLLASTSTDGSVAFWTTSPAGELIGQPVQFVERARRGPAHMVCAAWSRGGALLAAGGQDHHLRVYRVAYPDAPKRVVEQAAHSDAVDSVSWAHHSLRLVTGSKDGSWALWLPGAVWQSRRVTIQDPADPTRKIKVCMVQWDASDRFIITALADCSIRVWCSRALRELSVLARHTDCVYVLEPHPALPGVFLSAGHDGRLVLWDARTEEVLAEFVNEIPGQGCGALFDAKWGGAAAVAASDSHGHLLLLGLGRGHPLLHEMPHELFFHTDYRPLSLDALGGALDELTETPPHLLPPPLLVDVQGAPHAAHWQRLVPGRAAAPPPRRPAAPEDDEFPIPAELLAAAPDPAPDPEPGPAAGGVWRGGGVRHAAAMVDDLPFDPDLQLVRPMSPARLRRAQEVSRARWLQEEEEWRRELRRRPLMICTQPQPHPRRAARREAREARAARPARASPSPPPSASPSGSDSSVRLSDVAPHARRRRRRARVPSSSSASSGSGSGSASRSGSGSGSVSWSASSDDAAPAPPAPRRPRRQALRYTPSPPHGPRPRRRAPSPRGPRRAPAPPAAPGPAPRASTSRDADDAAAELDVAAEVDVDTTDPDAETLPNGAADDGGELPECYRVGEWLTSVSPRKSPYFPQPGDELLYFKLGHQRYIQALRERDVYPVLPRDLVWERLPIADCEPVTVQGVKYRIKPPRVALLRLRVDAPAPAAPAAAAPAARRPSGFTVKYHDLPDVIDFLVLRHHYDTARERNWGPGDRFRCLIDDSWWTGVILENSAGEHAGDEYEFAARQFLCLRVRWDNGEVERVSPWDLEPYAPDRAPAQAGGSVPVLPRELAALLPAARGDWAAAQAALVSHVEQVMQLSVAEPFLAPTDFARHPQLARRVAYPVDLSTMRARCLNQFYRRAAAFQLDARMLAHNAAAAHAARARAARHAALVAALLLHVCSHWETADVTSKYHELAGKYSAAGAAPRRGEAAAAGGWRADCARVLAELLASPDAQPFREPVDVAVFPDYPSVVARPMDLGAVRRRLAARGYRCPADVRADIAQIFANSRAYNTNKRSRIYSMTVRLSALFAALWAQLEPRRTRLRQRGAARRMIRPCRIASDSECDLATVSRRQRGGGGGVGDGGGGAGGGGGGSSDSDMPLHLHAKGKGVGKRSARPAPGPSREPAAAAVPNGARSPLHPDHDYELPPEPSSSSGSASPRARRKRPCSSGSGPRARRRRRASNPPSDPLSEPPSEPPSEQSDGQTDTPGSTSSGDSSSDDTDDAPLLHYSRQREAGENGAGPSAPRAAPKRGVRLRAREECSYRELSDDERPQTSVSISSRGRLRRLTAKARGLLDS